MSSGSPPLAHRPEPTANAILIDEADNVVTLTAAVQAGDPVRWAGGETSARASIPFGHKVAIANLERGSEVIKYGYPIGKANGPLRAGDLIHCDQLQREEP